MRLRETDRQEKRLFLQSAKLLDRLVGDGAIRQPVVGHFRAIHRRADDPASTIAVSLVKNAGWTTTLPDGVVMTPDTVTPTAGGTPGGGVCVNSKSG